MGEKGRMWKYTEDQVGVEGSDFTAPPPSEE